MGFMVMALLPTLHEQISEGMNVEAVIEELRSMKASSSTPSLESSVASLASSVASLDSSASSSSSLSSHVPTPKSKAALWHTIKIMTLTRLLTTLYSSTLLSLLTLTQLSLLARQRYLASVFQQCRDERLHESMDEQLSIASLLFKGGEGLEELMSGNMDALFPDLEIDVPEDDGAFLTLSWWLIHEGWRDIARRVRAAVEEVLGGTSLREEMSPTDLFIKIKQIRRRIEKDSSFEEAMLPSTDAMTIYVLSQGGFADAPPSPIVPASIHESELSDSEFSWLDSASQLSLPTESISSHNNHDGPATPPAPLPEPLVPLLSETRTLFASPDWSAVLRPSLDGAISVWEADALSAWKDNGNVEEPRQSFASLLPALARWNIMTLPSPLVDRILSTYEPMALSAILFGRFEDHVGER
ncbi:hypothetical protein BDZ89DRAFT_1062303 [Hymenopellis radicata]|nr:hypothetical protein BDZ89DRAFT_1062303 [Hymenopellis radicata]